MSTQAYIANPQQRQRGYGLVEVMISLVIIAILVAVAIALSINLRTNASITANTNHITQIAANAKKSFGVTNQYSALTQTRAVRTVVPRELRTFDPQTQQYADTAFNNFGGQILFGFSHLSNNGDSMVFVWQNVPKDQCEQIVTQTAGIMRRVEVEQQAAGAALTAATIAPSSVYGTAGVIGGAVVTVASIARGSASGTGGAGAVGGGTAIIVKATDTELSTGALNDACNTGSENVNLIFWAGRS